MPKTASQIWALLETVKDPEVPVLSVVDLGIIRDVKEEEGAVEVVITPTYSGCPAMNMIEWNIRTALAEAGYQKIKITTVLSPPWTTDWMSESGREKLKAYGIAPPEKGAVDKSALFAESKPIPCPNCDSLDTEMVSQFGSTPCKAHYKCLSCLEPFDYFKCH